jgi:hypothetical protein
VCVCVCVWSSKPLKCSAHPLTSELALQSKAGKAAFLEQCAGIVTSVEDVLSKQVQAADAKKATRAARAAALQQLVEAQREYYRDVKSMQLLAERNEQLQALLATHSERSEH